LALKIRFIYLKDLILPNLQENTSFHHRAEGLPFLREKEIMEIGGTKTVDSFGGSYFFKTLTLQRYL